MIHLLYYDIFIYNKFFKIILCLLALDMNGIDSREDPQIKNAVMMVAFLPKRSRVNTLTQYPGISTSDVSM